MTVDQRRTGTAPARSWYFVAPSGDVVRGRAHTSVVANQLLRLRRDPAGDVIASLGDGAPPVAEQGGLIFLWLGGGAPSFAVPRSLCAGWDPLGFDHVDVATHPSTVMQDLADLLHFETVHRYARVRLLEPLAFDGASMTTAVAFGWDTGIPGAALPSSFRSEVWGLGAQRTDVCTLWGRLRTRHLVLPTPYRDGLTRVHMAVGVEIGPGRGVAPRLIGRGVHAFAARAFRRDVGRDAALWVGRSGHHAADDAPMQAYRRWSAQFLHFDAREEPS